MTKLPFLLCLLAISGSLQAQEFISVDQIRPGMRGTGRTVFSGYTPEEFPVEVVEVLRNFYPKRDLILVRLGGDKTAFTGVAAGMSGSPIYLEGKLAGALSYSVGIFMKEPLAGVTPIGEMIEIFGREADRAQELAAISNPANPRFLEMALGLLAPEWDHFLPPLLQHRATTVAPFQPLVLPLSCTGMQPELLEQAAALLRPAGFVALPGGTAAGDEISERDLVPGAAVAAVLVSGDIDIEALGTLTYRDQNKLLAFGHPFFNSGPVQLPVSLAKVLTVLPSELSSSKMGVSALMVGALRQDRTTGVYGEIGAVPALLPLRVRYTDETGRETAFEFRFTDERSLSTLMPLVLRFVLVNALQSARLSSGENSLLLQGELQMADGSSIKLDNFYPGVTSLDSFGQINGILQSTGEVAATLGAVMANNFKVANLRAVDLHFASLPGRRSASVEQVWLDRSSAAPGDTVTVYARLRAYRGPAVLVREQLTIPKNVTGYFVNVVAGGSRELTQLDQRTSPGRFVISNFDQLAALLNTRRRSDLLYFQLRVPDRGLVVEGEELAALPPTAYAVLQSQNLKGNASPARERILVETRQRVTMPAASPRSGVDPLPYAISGTKIIRLRLR